jgi:hypothetical protein
MADNKNKSRDEGNMLPVVAANLVANIFELATDPDLKSKGGEVRGLGRANKVSMALFETAMSSFIEMRSGLSPAGKTLAIQLMDNVFDALRRLPPDSDHTTKIRALEEGGRSAMATVKKMVGTATVNSKFASLLAKLSYSERTILHNRIRRLEPVQLKEWNELKERIGSVDELRDALEKEDEDMMLSYLRMAYGCKKSAVEMLTDFAMDGTETQQLTMLRDKVSGTKNKADAKAAEWSAKADALRNRNRR